MSDKKHPHDDDEKKPAPAHMTPPLPKPEDPKVTAPQAAGTIKIESPKTGDTVKSAFEVKGTCSGNAKKVNVSAMYAGQASASVTVDVVGGKWFAPLTLNPAGYSVVAVIDGTKTEDKVDIRVQ